MRTPLLLFLTLISPGGILLLVPASSKADSCYNPSRRVIYHQVEEEKHYIPLVFVDLIQTYFTFPQVQFLQPSLQPQQVAPQQQSISPVVLPPMALYGGEQASPTPSAGGNIGQEDLTSLLKTHCASCHTGPAAKGSFQLLTPQGALHPQADLAEAWLRIKKGQMPPGRPLDPALQSRLKLLILR